MNYINTKHYGETETVDEATTYKEARELLKEYTMSDPSHDFWISSRSTKDWRES